jgi:hypothetical protein
MLPLYPYAVGLWAVLVSTWCLLCCYLYIFILELRGRCGFVVPFVRMEVLGIVYAWFAGTKKIRRLNKQACDF